MMRAQPGTSGTWGLGHTLFIDNGAGGHVVGHDGGTYPAWGAAMRVNPATGNGIGLMASGGRVAVSQLADDWIYWETGKITFGARQAVVYTRLLPASLAIGLGSIALVLWRLWTLVSVAGAGSPGLGR